MNMHRDDLPPQAVLVYYLFQDNPDLTSKWDQKTSRSSARTNGLQDKGGLAMMLDLIKPILINIIYKDCHVDNMTDIINPFKNLTNPKLKNLLSGTDNPDDILLEPYIAKDEHYANIEEQCLSL